MDNVGKILVIGGSPQHHTAPILTALGALGAGTGIVHIYSCPANLESAKNYSENFVLHSFQSYTGSLGLYDVKIIYEIAQDIDAIAIGNGLGQDFDSKKALLAIININKPIIIDADALVPEILKIYDSSKHHWILTPHVDEFERLFKVAATSPNILEISQKYKINLCVKGHIDYIVTANDFTNNLYSVLKNDLNNIDLGEKIYINNTGVPEMQINGIGDVLAGIICSYIAQGLTASHAMKLATYLFGKCAEQFIKTSEVFSAESLAKFFPQFNAT